MTAELQRFPSGSRYTIERALGMTYPERSLCLVAVCIGAER
ncbi:hypothetical protein HMPREF1556_01265 [Porphyromonas sp. oral taxon 278 str. W7784]|nr:hypothetical protein HMPREF1556_01265 [Porphyromonas sp. oral taxon 278 str. W7784]